MDPVYVIGKMHSQLIELRQAYDDALEGNLELSELRKEVQELRVMIRAFDELAKPAINKAASERDSRKQRHKLRFGRRWPKQR